MARHPCSRGSVRGSVTITNGECFGLVAPPEAGPSPSPSVLVLFPAGCRGVKMLLLVTAGGIWVWGNECTIESWLESTPTSEGSKKKNGKGTPTPKDYPVPPGGAGRVGHRNTAQLSLQSPGTSTPRREPHGSKSQSLGQLTQAHATGLKIAVYTSRALKPSEGMGLGTRAPA